MQPSGGGLGNRELVSVSGLAVALATGRCRAVNTLKLHLMNYNETRVALVDWYGVTADDVSDIHQMYDNPYGLLLSFPKVCSSVLLRVSHDGHQVRSLWETWSGWKSQKMFVFDSTNVYDERWGADDLVCTDLEQGWYLRRW